MLFNTWTFLIFLSVTFTAYHFLPWPDRHRVWWQIGLLTVASYVFYAWHTPWLVIILAASTWINAYVTLRLVRPGSPPEERKKWVTFAIMANLGVLIFFKYASLVVGTFFPHTWWSHWGFDLTQIPLPVGISFFTFQGVSLVVDVYRKPSVVLSHGTDVSGSEFVVRRSDQENQEPGTRNQEHSPSGLFFKVAFFKAFFPQLVAGPIVKAREFMHQIGLKRLSQIDWEDATRKLVLGFFFKMVVADNLKEATQYMAYPMFTHLPSAQLLLMLYGFSFQIFADFCGYSLIAMGLARLFGYQLPINFNSPYLSGSITEFWRRWHISLSTWLKQYLYIPLGGNRKGQVRTYMNLLVVMLLGGLWHGAAWSYMVWGGVHGLFLATERLFGCKGDSVLDNPAPSIFQRLPGLLRIFLTFNLVSFLWLLFKLPQFSQAVLYLKGIAAMRSGILPQSAFIILFFSIPIPLYHCVAFFETPIRTVYRTWHPAVQNGTKIAAFALLLFMIFVNSGTKGDFIYFQF